MILKRELLGILKNWFNFKLKEFYVLYDKNGSVRELFSKNKYEYIGYKKLYKKPLFLIQKERFCKFYQETSFTLMPIISPFSLGKSPTSTVKSPYCSEKTE